MTGDRRPKPLIAVSEAAYLAGVSRSVAYQWVRAGCMPGHVELNGRHYVKRQVLLAWLAGDGGSPGDHIASEWVYDSERDPVVGKTVAGRESRA